MTTAISTRQTKQLIISFVIMVRTYRIEVTYLDVQPLCDRIIDHPVFLCAMGRLNVIVRTKNDQPGP